MTKEEARFSVMGAISMALKDPTLQQGFEIICKNLSELEETNAKLQAKIDDWQSEYIELEKELEQAKKVQVVEHFEAYGQCRDSRRIAGLEQENAELKVYNEKLLNSDIEKHNKIVELNDKLNNLSKVAEVRLANWQKYEEENAELKTRVENQKSFLEAAKEIIRDLLGRLYSVEYDRVTDLEEAEQFLKEDK